VFPTGIRLHCNLETPNRFDIDDGMADNRIGVAHLDLPDFLPAKNGCQFSDSNGVNIQIVECLLLIFSCAL
jgi:hypothetical protein